MRVRNSNGADTAACLDGVHRRIVEQADAVPKHIAVWCLNEQGALTDGEARHCANAGDVRVNVLDPVVKFLLHFRDSRPALPLDPDVLSFVLADGTMLRRGIAFPMLDTTRHTNIVWHVLSIKL